LSELGHVASVRDPDAIAPPLAADPEELVKDH